MEIILTTSPASELETGALVALAFSRAKNGDKNGESKPADTPPETSIAGLDAIVGGWVSEVYASREFTCWLEAGGSLSSARARRASSPAPCSAN
jgi:hypothetical protein